MTARLALASLVLGAAPLATFVRTGLAFEPGLPRHLVASLRVSRR